MRKMNTLGLMERDDWKAMLPNSLGRSNEEDVNFVVAGDRSQDLR